MQAIERAELARSQAQALEDALAVDDLEADNKPEDLLLSYVSGEKGKDHSDRELVTPWFRFLWETYRTVLEILRNNSKLEALYAMTAHRSFQFCKQYKRTSEFRRLCEIIQNHLANLNKYRDQRDRPDLSAPESLQMYLDTRFDRLKVATELELWQFIASSVVLAALSVCPCDHTYGATHLELENGKERNLRVANLIGFNVEPKPETREVLSRSSLLAELVSKGVMVCVTQEVKDLYHLLEHEFLPLDIASKVQPLLTKISKLGGKLASASSIPEVQLSRYIPSLENLVTLRLLQQVSTVYETMRIEKLSKMIPFYEFATVEKISVEAVKCNFIAMKIDHVKGSVFFGNQGFESVGIRDHLSKFSESLSKAREVIYPAKNKGSKLGEAVVGLGEIVDKEHKRLLARKSLIEKRKEEQERHLLEMEREEESKRIKLQRITEEAEKRRLASEYEQRKNQRILREIEDRENEEKLKILNERRFKKKGKKAVIEGEKITKQTLMELAMSEQLRERQEMEKKLQKLGKIMDHLERAKREEGAPLIQAAFQQRLVAEQALHEREQQVDVRYRRDSEIRARKSNTPTIFEDLGFNLASKESGEENTNMPDRCKNYSPRSNTSSG